MYDQSITSISLDTLGKIAEMIDFPVCLCGGWTVFFTVNPFFMEKKNRDYLGSQDIDIGLFLPPMISLSEIESTSLFKIVHILESNGFQPEGFRYKKIIQIEKDDNGQKNSESEFFFTVR